MAAGCDLMEREWENEEEMERMRTKRLLETLGWEEEEQCEEEVEQ